VGDVDPNTGSPSGEPEGGTPQGDTESGQGQAASGRKRWSIQDEVKELRAQRRELRQSLAEREEVFRSFQDELRALREAQKRREQLDIAKTPANFWQDPEAKLNELKEEISKSQVGLMEAFHRTREEEFQRQALRQEQESAVEFIRSQPGYNSQDDEDLIAIIEDIPNRQYQSPKFVAEHAWLKLQAQRGVVDRSLAKARASGVQGQPPGVGFGRKMWQKADFDAAVDMLEKNPTDPKNVELMNELMAAHKEGRVK